ncbi:MAG TPA: acylphosphatase [Rubrobacteraceae bacterium]
MTSKEQANVLRSHLFVSGLVVVQDATIKDSVRREAKSFGLRGWVRDTQDGRVEAVFEGEPKEVRLTIRWCYGDRSGAEVHSTSVHQETPSHDLPDFDVR